MALYTDEGVVLRTAKLGEADRIITLFTRMHGKVRAVAKGVRRTKSRFGGRLEPFMRVNVLIAEGRSLDVISQAETISAYASSICLDYDAYMAAGIMAETAGQADRRRARGRAGAVPAADRRPARPVQAGPSGAVDQRLVRIARPGVGRLDAAIAILRGLRHP